MKLLFQYLCKEVFSAKQLEKFIEFRSDVGNTGLGPTTEDFCLAFVKGRQLESQIWRNSCENKQTAEF